MVNAFDGGFVTSVDVDRPKWLDEKYVYRYLPEYEPIVYAALRARVYLVSKNLMDRLNPPRAICISNELVDRARKLFEDLRTTIEDLSRKLLERLDLPPRHYLDILRDLARVIDDVAKKVFNTVPRTKCSILTTLAFYTPNASIYGIPNVASGPAIFICTERIDEVVEQELAPILRKLGYESNYYVDECKRHLFEYSLAHEITHSYADLAPSDAPKRRFENLDEGRIIEESLATYYGLKNLCSYDLCTIVRNWIFAKHTAEYRAAIALQKLSENTVSLLLKAWIGIATPSEVFTYTPPMEYLREILMRCYDLFPPRHCIYFLSSLVIASLLSYPLGTIALTANIVAKDDAFWRLLALYLLISTPPPP